ncbi:hypothetical protein [Flavisphingomonas formosensis]|uniref:hypothetical protein n=1 Tax=Flavisphingomonas formosensis TaxID=861534 RepID=UPI0012F84B2A|nr:hypothetical protein [Sphingomonas formosensis]
MGKAGLRRVFLTAACFMPVLACSPSSPDESGFASGEEDTVPRLDPGEARSILQRWFDTHLQCTPFFAMPWDLPVDATYSRKRAQAFIDAGLLRFEGEQMIPDPNSGSGRRQVARYGPTPEGAKQFRPGAGDLKDMPVTLCYGRPVISDVEIGTVDDMMRQVDVTYRYRLANIPTWARAPSLQAFYPGFKDWLAREEDARQTFRYKDGSWALEQDPSPARFDLRQLAH